MISIPSGTKIWLIAHKPFNGLGELPQSIEGAVAALNAELTHHLGHEKNQPKSGTNSRNGYSTKTVTITDGPMELRTPRDRDGSFEPQLVKKNQTRITGMDNQILALYARGMTTREITSVFKEMYDADVSPALISKVTDAVID